VKIGLALSGGGALGAAHVGVLEELEKHKVKIDEISGTSAGAIMGAIYASGGLKSLNAFFEEITKIEFYNQKKPFSLVTPVKFYDKIFQIFEKYSLPKIEDMPIKLVVVATNLGTGNRKVFSKGSTVEAVKASSAYPGVFPIQTIDGQLYVDGGITCNLPSEPIRKSSDFVIGSELYGISEIAPEKIKKMNRVVLLLRTLDILQKEIAAQYAKDCDFCFRTNPETLKWYSFTKMAEIRERGKQQAREQMSELLKRLKSKS
jgi:NTE family protein